MATLSPGEKAGLPRYELLAEPLGTFVDDMTDFARDLCAMSGQDFDRFFPDFELGVLAARAKAVSASMRRGDMPVVEEADLEDLRKVLEVRGYSEICEECIVYPHQLRPTQCQVYCDIALRRTIERGPADTREFLRTNRFVIDSQSDILDGHHRWFSAMVMDQMMPLRAFRVKVPLKTLMGIALDFSDSRHARNA